MDISDKIYLNIEPESTTYLCWCEDRQNDTDIEYIRKTDKKLTYFTQEEIDESLNDLIEYESKIEKYRDTVLHLDDCIMDNNKIIDELERENEKLFKSLKSIEEIIDENRKINNKINFKNKYSLPRYDELENNNETLIKFFIDNKFLSDCIDCNLDDSDFCGMKSVKIAIEQIKRKPIEEILKDYE